MAKQLPCVKQKRAAQTKRVAMVEFGWKSFGCKNQPNELCYVNHNCQPNTYMRVAFSNVEFYTLRPIKKRRILSAIMAQIHNEGKLKCTCANKLQGLSLYINTF